MARTCKTAAFIAALESFTGSETHSERRIQAARTKAAAYLIWADCRENGWDRSLAEIAEATGLTPERVMKITSVKGWIHRIRREPREIHRHTPLITAIDGELDQLGTRMPWSRAA